MAFPGYEKYLPIADYLIRTGHQPADRVVMAGLLVPDWDIELAVAQGIDWPSADETYSDEFGEL